VCGTVPGVCKDTNAIIKQVSPLVDCEVVACQLVFFSGVTIECIVLSPLEEASLPWHPI